MQHFTTILRTALQLSKPVYNFKQQITCIDIFTYKIPDCYIRLFFIMIILKYEQRTLNIGFFTD